jgi:hypothetical protein
MFKSISGPQLPVEGKTPGRPDLKPIRDAIVAMIPFETASNHPDDAAMDALTAALIQSYQEELSQGSYRASFDGHASRTGDDSLWA